MRKAIPDASSFREPKAVPNKIVLARESRGWTQTNLADATKTTQGFVSRIENELSPAPLAFLERAANELHYPIELFYQTDSILNSAIDELFHRKRATGALVLRALHARANLRLMQTKRLVAPYNLACGLRQMPIDEFDGDVEKVARAVRAMLALQPGPIPDLVEALEAAGAIVIRFNFGTATVDGMSLWPRGCPPMLFLNSSAPRSRARLTLGHELGHLILHHFPTRDAEDEATRFASELLIDSDQFRAQFPGPTLRALMPLKLYWRVSVQAIIKKAARLGLISPAQEKSLWIQIGRLGYRKNEPLEDRLPEEKPTTITRLVRAHVDDLGYSPSDLSAALLLSTEEFAETYLDEGGLRLVT